MIECQNLIKENDMTEDTNVEKKPKTKLEQVADIKTEGKFTYRIKPNICHDPTFLNRSVEEQQKYILFLEERIERIENLGKKINTKNTKKK